MAYIENTTKYKITYYCELSLQSVSFTNLDFVNDKDICQLTDRYAFYIGGDSVLWSMIKAEHMTVSMVVVIY